MRRFVLGVICGVLLAISGLWGWSYASCRLGWDRPGYSQFSTLPDDPFLTGHLGQEPLRVTSSEVVALRNQHGSAAIEFTEIGPEFSEYSWRYRPPNGGAESRGTGRVFEHYEAVGQGGDGSTQVRDVGGNHFVSAGPFSLQWSAGGEGQCWLYLDTVKLGARVLSGVSLDQVEL